jgi:tetratricopeptide (TPR) repeat protein
MGSFRDILNTAVAAGAISLLAAGAFAQDISEGRADVPGLLAQLAQPDQDRWQRIERQILREWGRSGSAALDVIFQRGQSALVEGRAGDAVDHFSAVIDQDPEFAEAWNGRATAWFLLNRYGLSLADIERVLALNPQHFGALAGLGMILEDLGDLDAARAAFEASHAIHPHQSGVRAGLARLAQAAQGRDL